MKYISSNKKNVQILIEQCYTFGVRHVIISPGSRNAPLIIAFGNHPNFNCYSIPDERSAAFYALGMSRQLNQPVALVCTSGTATLNYAPALTEAFYQEIPLIAITADRPPYMIDQEDGQTIRQHNIFKNHIKYTTTLPLGNRSDELTNTKSAIALAFEKSLTKARGPVHINTPFEEPLYGQEEISFVPEPCIVSKQKHHLNEFQINKISNIIQAEEKIVIICGVYLPDTNFNLQLNNFSKKYQIPVLAAPTANLNGINIFNPIDLLFYAIVNDDATTFQPDVLITLGGPVVSKVTKQFLRAHKPKYHIDIDENPQKINTYGALTHKVDSNPTAVIKQLVKTVEKKNAYYLNTWKKLNATISKKQNEFYKNLKWCDLKIYDAIFKNITIPIDLHLGNSTPVRYAEFFVKHPLINYYANRGTSGIDGNTSTAAGAAIVSKKTTLLITGDISFIYDSNAFWNQHVPDNLKVLLINNNGGNIFKVINGPANTKQLDQFFVTEQKASAAHICKAFHINYLSASDEISFEKIFQEFLQTNVCTVLEVFTDDKTSAQAYKALINAVR